MGLLFSSVYSTTLLAQENRQRAERRGNGDGGARREMGREQSVRQQPVERRQEVIRQQPMERRQQTDMANNNSNRFDNRRNSPNPNQGGNSNFPGQVNPTDRRNVIRTPSFFPNSNNRVDRNENRFNTQNGNTYNRPGYNGNRANNNYNRPGNFGGNHYNRGNSFNNRRPVYSAYNPSWRYSFLPRRNGYFNTLPSSYININLGGFGYRYYDGVFYRLYNNLFRVIAPPIGIYINVLPLGYRRIYVHDYPYYYYNGTYYAQRDNNYFVVSPPVGAIVESIPDGYQTVNIDGETYYTVDGAQYKPVVQENGEIWYEVIKAN